MRKGTAWHRLNRGDEMELLPGSVSWEVTGNKPKGKREFLGPRENVQSDSYSRQQGDSTEAESGYSPQSNRKLAIKVVIQLESQCRKTTLNLRDSLIVLDQGASLRPSLPVPCFPSSSQLPLPLE